MNNRWVAGLALSALLAGCGGGSSGSVTTPPTSGTGGGSGSGTTGDSDSGTCSLSARKDWVLSQMREWYLFPDTLPAAPDASQYDSVETFLDALAANARAQGKDRYFTYLTSITEETEYFNSGATAGLGVRFTLDETGSQLIIAEAFENAPALDAGLDRGTAITAIGTNENTLVSVADLYAQGGTLAISDALGPSTVGTTRAFRVTDANGTRVVTLAKAEYDIDPVSSRYGSKVITEGGEQYGYINLRTFIYAADPELRAAIADFAAKGIDKVIVDLRYNGGGLLSTAELMSNLLGGNRSTSDVMYHVSFRPEKSSENETAYFAAEANAVSATKIAFIGMGGTASASELVMNNFVPYLGENDALIGTNTYGKPVGQIALDREACDDRLRVIALSLSNADNQGDYFDGMAGTVKASCQAADDLGHAMGDPQEASTRAALNFLQGKSCSPIFAGTALTTASVHRKRELLAPSRPSTAQREVPGLY
ncbi:peptidase S41 [Stakelama sp. CBK3Z-3]|uniref:Peptidase S41 n=1 Tax=Stakelama flava TaxID=2860338 RepID=A0ABS6XQB9_9SPHN|nr:S41 family peptidase [Stakelama flava]MBW4331978.1 peptidase S41 [Stakelama flava]